MYEINTRWTALGRRRAKKLDKTDRLDARAVARFVRGEAPALPVVYADDDTAVLDLLCAEREALLVEAGRLRNQLHALLMQVDPEYGVRLPKLDSVAGIKATTNYPLPKADGLQRRRAAGVRRLAARRELRQWQSLHKATTENGPQRNRRGPSPVLTNVILVEG